MNLLNEISPSVSTGGFVFVNSLGPVIEMIIAPIGAVRTMERMQSIKIICAHFRSGSSGFKFLNAIGPNAA